MTTSSDAHAAGWDRLPPEGPCLSPDGHDMVDVIAMHSAIPVALICTNCGARGTVVVFERP